MANNNIISKIKMPNNTVYNIRDNGAFQIKNITEQSANTVDQCTDPGVVYYVYVVSGVVTQRKMYVICTASNEIGEKSQYAYTTEGHLLVRTYQNNDGTMGWSQWKAIPSKDEISVMINNAISSVYKFKGSVATYNDLPSVGQTVGDVYNVKSDGYNYSWDGTNWNKLGGDIDLTNYATKDEIPKNVSSLYNDSGYLTQHQDISGKADKATTLSGYGITDAKIQDGTITLGSNTITPVSTGGSSALEGNFVPKASGAYDIGSNNLWWKDIYGEYFSGEAESVDWDGVLNKPTTLSGYGITDGYNYTQVLSSEINNCDDSKTIYNVTAINGYTSILPIDEEESALMIVNKISNNYLIQYAFTLDGRILARKKVNGVWETNFVDIIPKNVSDLQNDSGFLTSQDISGKADKATTLSGYGITDAKIQNGAITLGSNTITPVPISGSSALKGSFIPDASNTYDIGSDGYWWGNVYGEYFSGEAESVNWDGVTNRPTTLSGYGITDCYNKVERPYDDINVCLGLNTIYKITDIPNGTEIPDKGILFNILQGSNKTIQYLFTSAKQLLIREVVNGEQSPWRSITSSVEGELDALTEQLTQYVINEDLDWYPSINQIDYFTNPRALYKFVYPSSETSGPRNEFVALTYFTGQSDSIQDGNGNDIYPNGSQIIISQSGKMYIRKADNQGIFSTIEELKPDPEHGTITSNNKGWYTEENGVTKYLTGSYRLVDDMCILTGRAQIPYNWEELYYTLPITPTQGAATVSFNGGTYYYIGTTMRSSETVTNASVMRIARVDGERFSADTTIHFVLTYPYK